MTHDQSGKLTDERAAIVAWMRGNVRKHDCQAKAASDRGPNSFHVWEFHERAAAYLTSTADAIERGDHLPTTPMDTEKSNG